MRHESIKVRVFLGLVILLSAAGMGAYSNSNINVIGGCYSLNSDAGNKCTQDQVFHNPSHAFSCSGTVNSISALGISTAGTAATGAYILVLSGTESPYVIEHVEDVTAAFNAVVAKGSFSVSFTNLGIPISAGQWLGWYAYTTAEEGDYSTLKREITDATGESLVASNTALSVPITTSNTVETVGSSADDSIAWTVTLETNQYVITDKTNGGSGYGNGGIVNIDVPLTEPYWIVLEGVVCPDGESLAIALQYVNQTTGAPTANETYTIDMGAADTFSASAGTPTLDMTGQGDAAEKINYHIYINPTTSKQDVIVYNHTSGQCLGPMSVTRDSTHRSLNSGVPVAFTGTNILRRILFTNAGGNALVDRVVVTRKPIVAMGDSYVSSITTLAAIGALLDNEGVFSEKRYVINGAIGANLVTRDSPTYSTALRTRWNSTNNHLWAYRDSVFCFVNGPSINDISASIFLASTYPMCDAFADMLAGDIGRMAGDCLSGSVTGYVSASTIPSNDVILCEMIPSNYSYGHEAEETYIQSMAKQNYTIRQFNKNIQAIANRLGVPFVRTYSRAWTYTDSKHIDAAGYAIYADLIVDAYENNQVPVSPYSKTGTLGTQTHDTLGNSY